MIFLNINHFPLIISYHSVWLGFELFGLRVQVHSHWVQFYARAQRIWQSPFVMINPRQEMKLECRWRHAQKRWAENLEDFEKRSDHRDEKLRSDHAVEKVRLDHAGRQLSLYHWGIENWVFYCGGKLLEFFRSLPTEILNITRCVARLWSQIVWSE